VAETPKEKTDRQLIELLNELRVALPGAQVLLGFLLTAPLASRFGRTSELDRALLYLCTVITAAGVLFLMAPSVYHRVRWNEGGKQDVVVVGHQLFLIGTFCLALGLFAAVFVIGDLLFGILAASVATAAAFAVVLSTWYVLPLRRSHDPRVRAEE
jgi:hydrogenase-4 membrane subunit HyfE